MPPHPFELNLRHLRGVQAIVERGAMGPAAQAVSLSQPALTQGLAKLERQLGTRLFDRRPDGMAATPAGMAVAERTAAACVHLARALRGVAPRGERRGFARPDHLVTATQLRALLAVADAGGFVAAAERIGLSQPAVQRALRDLEAVLGAILVERRGRGVALTEAGRRAARGARLAAGEWATAFAEATGGVERRGGRIVVGAMPLCRARLLPQAVARLVAAADVQVEVVEGSWRDLVELLRDGVLDLTIGALREAPAPADLSQSPLFEDRPAIVARAGHPLAGPVEPPLERLAGYPWIVGPQGSPLRQHWEALFPGAHLHAPVECGSVMTLRGLLGAGDFLTLLSPEQVALEVETGLLAFVGAPLARFPRRIGVTVRPDWRPSVAQRLFLDILADIAGERAPADWSGVTPDIRFSDGDRALPIRRAGVAAVSQASWSTQSR